MTEPEGTRGLSTGAAKPDDRYLLDYQIAPEPDDYQSGIPGVFWRKDGANWALIVEDEGALEEVPAGESLAGPPHSVVRSPQGKSSPGGSPSQLGERHRSDIDGENDPEAAQQRRHVSAAFRALTGLGSDEFFAKVKRDERAEHVGAAIGIGLFLALLIWGLVFTDYAIRPVW